MQNIQEIHALRYPDNLGTYAELPPQRAAEMLMNGIRSSADRPYQWCWLDKPPEGAVYLLFLPPQKQAMPTDGIHFLQPNITSRMQLNPQAEIQMIEDRYGFTPGTGESMATRVRRRFSFPRGPHASFVLVHYTRGPATQIPPQLFAIPPRAPLQPLTQPAVYVTGPKAGTRVSAGDGTGMGAGAGMSGAGGPGLMNGMGGGMGMGGPMGAGGMPLVPGQAPGMMGMAPGQGGAMGGGMPPSMVGGMGGPPGGMGSVPGMGMGSIQDAAARQRANFDALDAQARMRGVPMAGMPMNPGGLPSGMPAPGMPGLPNAPPGIGINVPRRDIEAVPATLGVMGPPDETEIIEDEEISTRSLAAARYRRNHEWMEGVFMYAAFGERTLPPPPKKLKEIFPRDELDARVAALQAEVDALKSKKSNISHENREDEAGDASMLSVPEMVTS